MVSLSAGAIIVMGALCCGGLTGAVLGMFTLFGEARLGQIPPFAALVAVVFGGHAATSWWAVAARPGWWVVAGTQAPYVLAYAVGAPTWYFVRYPLGYVAWALAVAVAVSWLVVWYLREPRSSRRAVVFLSVLGVLVAGNAAGVAWIRWQATDGMGLLGQPEPWMAWRMAMSSSCLSGNEYHSDRTGTVRADCPTGPDGNYFAGEYDEDRWNRCAEAEAWEPFARWHEADKRHYSFTLHPSPDIWVTDGDTATTEVTVRVDHWGPFRVADGWTLSAWSETWQVEAHRVPLGGWKIARITVPAPIQVIPKP
ncbi:hypothetical protein F4553_005367 [Allocatelliglobosispora scoriae]|uniref:Uncharacterized protein n=1 Tax=Allocatelliglobosispora scoriae TaxID=643052 RepID=A0A841BWW8_9ACTN|nr:hypothetical protein [Allocatelliglobosispora scoriae]MBB5871988.1 hypothetical protein [Allocatelliglobosispora scoriae]